MDNNIKQHINQGILGSQSENPYDSLVSGSQQVPQQNSQPQETRLQGMPVQPQQQQQNFQQQPQQQVEQNQQPVNHQEAFEQFRSQQNSQQNQQQTTELTYGFEQNGTYCRTGRMEDGFLDVDLQIYKEKGRETRFVSFSVYGFLDESQVNEIKNGKQVACLTMMMSSEEQFNRFKNFVANLNWND